MTNEFWKQNAYWWVPIIVVLLSGIGYIIKIFYFQPVSVSGKIIDPPGEVDMFLNMHPAGKTSEYGSFRIDDVKPGPHTIQFKYVGYQTLETTIKVPRRYSEIRITDKLELIPEDSFSPRQPITNLSIETDVHSWYAGTTYVGIVDMSDKFGFIWECSGGTCKLKGPYGDGLNMEVCQELRREVGPLQYYYNDAGMKWTKSDDPELLNQCNTIKNNLPADIRENELSPDSSENYENFNINFLTRLDKLSSYSASCITRQDTSYRSFHGCIDWHSSVHAVWSLIRYKQITHSDKYDYMINQILNTADIENEFERIKQNTNFEMPYGRAWFLRLVIDYEKEYKSDLLIAMGDYIAESMVIYFTDKLIDPNLPNYDNPSWALVNLYQYSVYRNNPDWMLFVENLVITHFANYKMPCNFNQEINPDGGFIAVCSNWAYLVTQTGVVDNSEQWLATFFQNNYSLVPVIEPENLYQKGLNFSRAWSFYFLYKTTQDPKYLELYLNHIETQYSNQNTWDLNDYRLAHWLPQFGIYALTQEYN